MTAGGAAPDVAVADAEAEAEGYIGRVINLPVVTAGAALVRIGCDIARYNLWRRDVPADHPVAVAYRDAIKALQSVADGRVTLAGLVGTVTQVTKSTGFAVATSERVYTDTRLGMMEDPLMTPGAMWR